MKKEIHNRVRLQLYYNIHIIALDIVMIIIVD